MKTQCVCLTIGLLVLLLAGGQVDAKRRCKYYAKNLAINQDISMTPGIGSAEDCCNLCLANSACKGFTHYQANCWQKYSNKPLVSAVEGVSSGIIEDVPDHELETEEEAQSTKTCERHDNNNLAMWHDLRMIPGIFNFEDCCASCQADPACKGATHLQSNCWIKYDDAPLVPQGGITSGIMRGPAIAPIAKPAPRPPAPEGDCPFRFLDNVSLAQMPGFNISPGRDITVRHSSNFDQCGKNCLSCDGCVGFVFNPAEAKCYLKDNRNAVGDENEELVAGILQF